jgi:hypothetical protein
MPKGFGTPKREYPLTQHIEESWAEGAAISIFSKPDSITTGLGEVLITALPSPAFESIREQVLPELKKRVPYRYQEFGKGIVTLASGFHLESLSGLKPTNIPPGTPWASWDYWSIEELKAPELRDNIYLKTPALKPFILWATKHYKPEKEFILALIEIPLEPMGYPSVDAKAQLFRVPFKGGEA